MAIITCADPNGAQITRTVGWDNENRYFENRGNIAAHYCEGGYAGGFTTFISVLSPNGVELDPALLYFAGIPTNPTPSPEVSPEPSPATTEEVSRTTERTEDVDRSETVERTVDVERPVEPAPQPAPIEPEPTPEPTPESTPESTPEPTPEETKKPKPEPKPEPTTEPTLEPSPEPSLEPTVEPVSPVEPAPLPTEEPEEELLVLSVDKLVENLRNIGSDMTPEVREQAQQVVIASIIVSQIAITAIGRKP
jgi:hypothetical protein